MSSWEKFSRIVAEAKTAKKLDPVGHEDDDVDNDGDSDSSDSYLLLQHFFPVLRYNAQRNSMCILDVLEINTLYIFFGQFCCAVQA